MRVEKYKGPIQKKGAVSNSTYKACATAADAESQRLCYVRLLRQLASATALPFGMFGIRLGFSARPMTTSLMTTVGIFIDLDNVAPPTHGRIDAEEFVGPLKRFGNAAGLLNRFVAYGNLSTRSYTSAEEKGRRESMLDMAEWDEALAQTGYDTLGVLRCGVCGAKMSRRKTSSTVLWRPGAHGS